MDEQERKQHIQKTFNTVATGYDDPALAFFPKAAAHLPEIFSFKGHEHVLDIATGTGTPAMAIAPHLTSGKVSGVDFSEGMLTQAKTKLTANGLSNIELHQMDMQALAFPDNHFDAANASFAIFFVEDMLSLLNHITSKVKPNGKVVSCAFYDNSFSPHVDLFLERVQQYGVETPELSWKKIATEDKYQRFYESADELTNIKIHRKDISYYLHDADAWWSIIWNAGFRGLISQFEPSQLAQFKQEHLAEIDKLNTQQGIALQIEILFAEGTKK